MPASLEESIRILKAPWMGLDYEFVTGADLFRGEKRGEQTMLGSMTNDSRDTLLANSS